MSDVDLSAPDAVLYYKCPKCNEALLYTTPPHAGPYVMVCDRCALAWRLPVHKAAGAERLNYDAVYDAVMQKFSDDRQ